MTLKNQYRKALRDLLAAHAHDNSGRPISHIGTPSTGVSDCVRSTYWYVVGGDKPHYRYNRYESALRGFIAGNGDETHVDIGCGAGLFSWVFADWARNQGLLEHGRVRLYGHDHCAAALQVACQLWERFRQDDRQLPMPYLRSAIDPLCARLIRDHIDGMNYTITFGHVLIQAYQERPDTIAGFAEAISTVVRIAGARATCRLIAVDAKSRKYRSAFIGAWRRLLREMRQANIDFMLHHDDPQVDSIRTGYLRAEKASDRYRNELATAREIQQ